MPRRPLKRRVSPQLAALLVAGAGLVALTGCDVVENADVNRGRELFIRGGEQACGSCHRLAEAGTTAAIGPDLDAAFADARASGMDSQTVEGIVEAQVENPRVIDEDDPVSGRTFMPSGEALGLTEDEIRDIAAYVASVAGTGIKAPPFTPDGFFTQSCGSCHALGAAGTTGTTGPNLDEVLPRQSPDEVQQSIEDPEARKTPGFEDVTMPDGLAVDLTPEQFQMLIDYLLENAGK